MAVSVTPFEFPLQLPPSDILHVKGTVTPSIDGSYALAGTHSGQSYYDRQGFTTGRLFFSGSDWTLQSTKSFTLDTDYWSRPSGQIDGIYAAQNDPVGTPFVSVL